ncbi:thiosulfate reductase electron transport protein PhsB, partial [Escherichia coli]
PQNALLFGREDSPQIQQWLKTHDYYLYQLDGVGKPHLYRRVGPHVQGGDNV